MPIEIIDTLSQKNNGNFPLVDSNDIRGGFYQVNSIEERDLIPSIRRKEGMLCAVKNDKLYQLVGGIENINWVVFVSSDDEGYLKEITDTLNKKVDDIILTDDSFLNFYANNVLIKSIKIEGGSEIASQEIEQLKNTKVDDITVGTKDGITYIRLFANNTLLKSVEIKTGGESLIHVGADEPTADNCEVWIDVSDDEEYIGILPDLMLNEIKTIINNLQSEVESLKQMVVNHEARIVYLEVNGGGSSGGSGEGNKDTVYVPLVLETGELLTLEDGTILTLEDLNN